MGLEILEDAPDAAAVIASIGGGGLITGVGSAIKALKPRSRSAAPSRKPRRRCRVAGFAGIAAGVPRVAGLFRRRRWRQSVFPRMWQRMKPVVDGCIVVTSEETRRACG